MHMQRAFIFIVASIIIFCSDSKASANGLYDHSFKSIAELKKEQIPFDFIPRDLQILSIGDSLTKGVGDSSNSGGYIPYLKTKLEFERGIQKVHFLNYGVKGNTSKALLKRVRSKHISKVIQESDIVIITIGGNDLMKVVKNHFSDLEKEDFTLARKQYEENLRNIVYHIRDQKPNIPIIITGLYNPFSEWFRNIEEIEIVEAEWNSTIQQVVSSFQNTYFSAIDSIFDHTGKAVLHNDYFHPNDKGYSLIANRLHIAVSNHALEDLTKRRYTASKRGE
jgi:lysophospholipase L1-like esterase